MAEKKMDRRFIDTGFHLVDPKAPREKLMPPPGFDLAGNPDIREDLVEDYGEKAVAAWEAGEKKRAEEMVERGDLTPEEEAWAFKTLGWGEPGEEP